MVSKKPRSVLFRAPPRKFYQVKPHPDQMVDEVLHVEIWTEQQVKPTLPPAPANDGNLQPPRTQYGYPMDQSPTGSSGYSSESNRSVRSSRQDVIPQRLPKHRIVIYCAKRLLTIKCTFLSVTWKQTGTNTT